MAQNEREPTAITERCNGGSTNVVAANTAKATSGRKKRYEKLMSA